MSYFFKTEDGYIFKDSCEFEEIESKKDIYNWCRMFFAETDELVGSKTTGLLRGGEWNLLMGLAALLRDWFPKRDKKVESLVLLLSMADMTDTDRPAGYVTPLDLIFKQIETGKHWIPREEKTAKSLAFDFGSAKREQGGEHEVDWEYVDTDMERIDKVKPAECGGIDISQDFALECYKLARSLPVADFSLLVSDLHARLIAFLCAESE